MSARRAWIAAYLATLALPVVLMAISPYREGTATTVAIALGFVAYVGMALQVLMVSRSPKLSQAAGMDWLLRAHRYVGIMLVILVLVHVVVIFVVSPWAREWLLFFGQPWAAQTGTAAAAAMLGIGATSLYRTKFGMSYETWRLTHLVLTMLAMGGAYVHILYTSDFSWSTPLRTLATICLMTAGVALVYLRFGRAFNAVRTPYVVAATRLERGQATTLILKPVGHAGIPFRPGQFAWLRLDRSPLSLFEHPLSVSSDTSRTGTVSFTARTVGDGTQLVQRTPPGTPILVDGPHGGYPFLDSDSQVLIAGGIGITPIMSVVRTLTTTRPSCEMTVVYCVRTKDAAPFSDELETWAAEAPQHRFLTIVESSKPTGRLTSAKLGHLIPAPPSRASYLICGPQEFCDDVEHWLAGWQVPRSRVHVERFSSI